MARIDQCSLRDMHQIYKDSLFRMQRRIFHQKPNSCVDFLSFQGPVRWLHYVGYDHLVGMGFLRRASNQLIYQGAHQGFDRL